MITSLIPEIKKVSDSLEIIFQSLSEEQLNFKYNPTTWSIGECLDHIIFTNELYFQKFEKIVNGQHKNPFLAKFRFYPTLFGNLIKNSVDPKNAKKTKTFKVFEPLSSNYNAQIFENFNASQQKLIQYIQQFEKLHYSSFYIHSPVTNSIVLHLPTALEIITLHEQRHLIQIQNVYKSLSEN